ncbi:MAG: hypothetical protein ABIC19_01910 [Patescibacteria group bacterium]|nr:hypothetical protein [Patescibacteria group bacterium]
MIRKFFKFFLSLALVFSFFIVAQGFWPKSNYINKARQLIEVGIGGKEEKVPAPTGLKKVNYSWTYKGKNFSFSKDLYDSIFKYYQSRPKVFSYMGSLPLNWENEYYEMFLKKREGDDSMEELARIIGNLGQENGLSDDEIVELAASFTQSIDYDSAKAKKILAGAEDEKPRFAYEVLYEKKGVCSGKTFLLVSVLRELGYGAAILEYESETHMAAGVLCPKEYSVDNSGYCYIESTNPGHKIGIVPELDSLNNAALAKGELGYFNESSGTEGAVRNLSRVRIYQKTQGKVYQGIGKTMTTIKDIEGLETQIFNKREELEKEKQRLDNYKEELGELEREMGRLKRQEKYDEYNDLVPRYNNKAEEVRGYVVKYNKEVKNFNSIVDKYNLLVRSF